MPVHPPTGDGYFEAGDPLTGERPAGAFFSLEFCNALLDLIDSHAIGYGEPVTLAAETTLTADHVLIFLNPAAGTTVPFHLPVYAAVSATKRFKVKNIGLGVAAIDAADGKTIDSAATLELVPGDKADIAKDASNWQTI